MEGIQRSKTGTQAEGDSEDREAKGKLTGNKLRINSKSKEEQHRLTRCSRTEYYPRLQLSPSTCHRYHGETYAPPLVITALLYIWFLQDKGNNHGNEFENKTTTTTFLSTRAHSSPLSCINLLIHIYVLYISYLYAWSPTGETSVGAHYSPLMITALLYICFLQDKGNNHVNEFENKTETTTFLSTRAHSSPLSCITLLIRIYVLYISYLYAWSPTGGTSVGAHYSPLMITALIYICFLQDKGNNHGNEFESKTDTTTFLSTRAHSSPLSCINLLIHISVLYISYLHAWSPTGGNSVGAHYAVVRPSDIQLAYKNNYPKAILKHRTNSVSGNQSQVLPLFTHTWVIQNKSANHETQFEKKAGKASGHTAIAHLALLYYIIVLGNDIILANMSPCILKRKPTAGNSVGDHYAVVRPSDTQLAYNNNYPKDILKHRTKSIGETQSRVLPLRVSTSYIQNESENLEDETANKNGTASFQNTNGHSSLLICINAPVNYITLGKILTCILAWSPTGRNSVGAHYAAVRTSDHPVGLHELPNDEGKLIARKQSHVPPCITLFINPCTPTIYVHLPPHTLTRTCDPPHAGNNKVRPASQKAGRIKVATAEHSPSEIKLNVPIVNENSREKVHFLQRPPLGPPWQVRNFVRNTLSVTTKVKSNVQRNEGTAGKSEKARNVIQYHPRTLQLFWTPALHTNELIPPKVRAERVRNTISNQNLIITKVIKRSLTRIITTAVAISADYTHAQVAGANEQCTSNTDIWLALSTRRQDNHATLRRLLTTGSTVYRRPKVRKIGTMFKNATSIRQEHRTKKVHSKEIRWLP